MNTKLGNRATVSAKGSARASNTSRVAGRTDWAALKAMPDSKIKFTPDAPQTTPGDWASAVAHRGLPLPARKEQIALRVDTDVINWFRSQGAGWQTRMNAVLKTYRDAVVQGQQSAV